jgi:hypothetical protein
LSRQAWKLGVFFQGRHEFQLFLLVFIRGYSWLFMRPMRLWFSLPLLLWLGWGAAYSAPQPTLLTKVTPLPVALDPHFQFRKAKLYFLGEQAENLSARQQGLRNGQSAQGKPGRLASTAPSTKTATSEDASILFERQYRLFGAVTKLDQHQRFGNYFDFFWRAKEPADLTVRLEYRQAKLHAHVQAQEVSYPGARGNYKTEFKVVGDDYFDDGRVIAWRCLLIKEGKIVAEKRSYMWE